MAPTIGITTYHASADWRGRPEDGALLPWAYVTAVRGSGGRPVLLPPGGDAAEAAETVAALDGVLLAGGDDIDPAIYGAARHPRTGPAAPDRDAWELAVAGAALGLGVPLLGICRGMQLLNVARGGTLHQHVPDLVGHQAHGGTAHGCARHPVRVTGGATVRSILPGGEYFAVPTRHHQAVARVGDGLLAVARADDGIIEAIESATPGEFLLGVQWHPEQGDDARLFTALVSAADTHHSERAGGGSWRVRRAPARAAAHALGHAPSSHANGPLPSSPPAGHPAPIRRRPPGSAATAAPPRRQQRGRRGDDL